MMRSFRIEIRVLYSNRIYAFTRNQYLTTKTLSSKYKGAQEDYALGSTEGLSPIQFSKSKRNSLVLSYRIYHLNRKRLQKKFSPSYQAKILLTLRFLFSCDKVHYNNHLALILRHPTTT